MANDYVEKIDLDGEQWDLKDSPLSEQVSSLQTYSTTEINTGMKWIDGKPIYRKVVDFGSLPNNTYKDKDTGIRGVDTVINIRGYSSNGNIVLPLPNASSYDEREIQVSFTLSSGVLRITTGDDRTGYTNTKVILEYTKATS
ncbi:MAG: hypothetical protein J6S67_23875 [Methanobrevibacter sp.]|nr:hypothetical protein [Methanobrevibacter sp.]